MRRFLPPLRFTGASVLRDGMLQKRSIGFAEGKFTKGPLPAVDLTGYLVLPGIIDLHGDAFERHMAPRPSAHFPMDMGLRATDRDTAAAGVTTAWMAQSWSWEAGMRAPDYAEKFMAAVADAKPDLLTDLRVQIRCEIYTCQHRARLIEAIKWFGVDYVIFNDHLKEAVELAKVKPQEIEFWAKKAGKSAEDHMACVHAALKQEAEVPAYLEALAEAFEAEGVTFGSHDDPDAEMREYYAMIGAKICEFPTSFEAAEAAKAMGDPVLMGAPNVVRGGSQSGNIAAADLVKAGLCDVLVSDYHYPSLAAAAFRLVADGVLALPEAWAMISSTPAQLLGLSDRGEIAYGKRADLVVVNPATQAVEMTIAHGRLSYLSGEAARRFANAHADLAIAAE